MVKREKREMGGAGRKKGQKLETRKVAQGLKVRKVILHKPTSILTQENPTHPTAKSGLLLPKETTTPKAQTGNSSTWG